MPGPTLLAALLLAQAWAAPPGTPGPGAPPPSPTGEGAGEPAAEAPVPPEGGEGAEPPTRFLLGVTLGGTSPAGSLVPGIPLRSVVPLAFAIDFEALVRLLPEVAVGLHCRATGSDMVAPYGAWCYGCTPVDLGLGLLVRWSPLPRGAAVPWLSVSAGLEDLFDEDGDAFSYWGWEVGATAGLDVRVERYLGLGAFLGSRWGQFFSSTVQFPFPPASGPAAWHGWVDFGVRITVGL